MLFLISVLIILLAFLIYKRQQQMTILQKLSIPGPKPNFIFGNLLEIAKEGLHGVFPKWTKQYGKIVGFYVGGWPQILITDMELVRRVMIKDFHMFSNRNQCIPGGVHPQPELQNMLVWVKDNVWRQLRASLSPSFTSHKLNAMEPLIMSSIDNLMDKLDENAKSGQEFNVKPLITELTFSSGGKCIFGLNLSLERITSEAKNFLNAALPRLETSKLATLMVLFPSASFIAYPLRVWWERLRLYMQWSPEGAIYSVAKKIVQVRKEGSNQYNDFLQLLLNAKRIKATTDADLEMRSKAKVKENKDTLDKATHTEKLTEEEVLANAMLFLLASFETTLATIEFVINSLIQNQDVQEKLRNELKKAVEKGSQKIDFATATQVPLLHHVVKETLRMYPPVSPLTSRVASADYEYEGIRIPKGTTVFIGVSSIHNDPELWPEPEKFLPERFEGDFDKLTFLPFGAGPRNCIGKAFAYMEVQFVLANLILKYKFEAGPSTEKNIETVETFATLIPKNGVFCKVIKIEE